MIFNKKDRIEIFENAFSWIVVFNMFAYGIAKKIQFKEATTIPKNVSELTGMELMWALYGYSEPFAITLGVFEIIGALLILIKKTRIIGCLFTSVILINIIIQDIYFGVHIGALRAAIIYQSIVIVILWINKEKLFKSINELLFLEPNNIDQPKKKLFLKLIIAFGFFVAMRILEHYVTSFK